MGFAKSYTAVVADDHSIIRTAISASLTDLDAMSGNEIKVVDEVENGIDAIASIRSNRPDIVLLDITMPHAGGTEVLLEAKRWSPESKVVVFTGVEASGKIAELVDVGADGVFCKSDDISELTDALPSILQGGRIICRRYTQMLEKSADLEPLTDRERQVLNLVVGGQTNKEIADTLGISVKTVDRHRTSVMSKTGSHSAAGLIAFALREGLIDPSSAS
ncbi:Response regulator protein VraR [Altererythrobacter insulae]|nr:Response regulator protein VraR [Altererythrobacter insulae]